MTVSPTARPFASQDPSQRGRGPRVQERPGKGASTACHPPMPKVSATTLRRCRARRAENAARCAAVQALYGRLFDWLNLRINKAVVSDKPGGSKIGVLDIFGFEIFGPPPVLPAACRLCRSMHGCTYRSCSAPEHRVCCCRGEQLRAALHQPGQREAAVPLQRAHLLAGAGGLCQGGPCDRQDFLRRYDRKDSSTSRKGRLSCSKAVPFFSKTQTTKAVWTCWRRSRPACCRCSTRRTRSHAAQARHPELKLNIPA